MRFAWVFSLILSLGASNAQAGCIPDLLSALWKPTGVVAVYRYNMLEVQFGDEETPDRVFLGDKYRLKIYEGRVTRIPLRRPRRLREVNFFHPGNLLPSAGKVPASVRHRVTGYTDLSVDEIECPEVIGTEDGALVLSYLPCGGGLQRSCGIWDRNKTLITGLLVPTRLKYVTKASIRSLGKKLDAIGIDPEILEVDRPGPYTLEYLMVAVTEGLTNKNWLYPDEVRGLLDRTNVDKDSMGNLQVEPEIPEDNSETWVVRAKRGYHNVADPKAGFEYYPFGVEAIQIADDDVTGFSQYELEGSVLTLDPDPGQAICTTNCSWRAPREYDLRPLLSLDPAN
ncbi:hypothetical protein K2X33_05340 [bacterium]|nr:hypothetical protein [bacterium]